MAKRLRTMGAELTTVWGGTLYMPEDTEFNDSNFGLPAWLFWLAHLESLRDLRGSAGHQR